MIITELSPTVGGTGVPSETGSISESLLKGFFNTQEKCTSPTVYRLDRSSGSLSIIEDTANANSTVANSFTPFNSDGDEFAINCAEDFQGILFRLDTQGNHSATLKVKDSTDGSWASNQLTVTDGSNAFEATTGWHYITIPDNASRKAFKLSNDPTLNTPSGKYILFRLDGIVGGDTMPKISNLTLIRKNLRFDDHTASVNGVTGTAPSENTHYPWVGSSLMWCTDNPVIGLKIYMHLAASSVITDTHEYLASDNTWKTMTGWTNGSNDFTAGPTVLGNPVETFNIRHDMPTDWVKKSQTVTLDSGLTTTVEGYWVRKRTLTVIAYGPKTNPRYRLRAFQFGSANTTGIEALVTETIRGLRFLSATIPNTTTINGEVVNMNTGKSSPFILAANPVFPLNADITDLTIPAGEKYALIVKSGGTVRNLQTQIII